MPGDGPLSLFEYLGQDRQHVVIIQLEYRLGKQLEPVEIRFREYWVTFPTQNEPLLNSVAGIKVRDVLPFQRDLSVQGYPLAAFALLLDLHVDELKSISCAEVAVARLYAALGINSYNEIIFIKIKYIAII